VAIADRDDAVAEEAALVDQFGDPALFRLQIDVAAEDLVVAEVGGCGEVAEVELAQFTLEAEATWFWGMGVQVTWTRGLAKKKLFS